MPHNFAANDFSITDPTDPTKKLVFDLSGLPASTTRTVKPNPTANGTMALTDWGNYFTAQQVFGDGILSEPISGSNPAVKCAPFPNQQNRLLEVVNSNGADILAINYTGSYAGNGASGSFQTPDGKTVTVTAGVITSIV